MTDRDILVVGAGPTGLTAALQASAHGATVRIVDRRAHCGRPSRALLLHGRALECLRPLGVTDDLLARADTAPRARLHLGSHVLDVELGEVDLPDTAFPHLTVVSQATVEEVLASSLRARGVRVEWGVELLALRPSPGGQVGVRAELRSAERGREEHACRFVVGCDGQSSTVRGVVGAAWRGRRYAVEAVLADVEVDEALDPRLVHVAVQEAGLAFLFPLGEGARWRMLTTRAATGGGDVSYGDLGPPVPREEVRDLLHGTGLGVTLGELSWSARVPLQHRVASRFRRGPVFLAGDAAHAHSPAGGQGMNNGILDAVNLGWKLAFASRGEVEEDLLDSYEQERRPAAREVLALTHVIFFGEASTHRLARIIRGTLLPSVAPLLPLLVRPRLTASAVRLLAQPFVRYRKSPLSVDLPPVRGRWPRPGDRLPDQAVMTAGGPTRLHDLTATPGVHVLLERDARADSPAVTPAGSGSFVHVHRLSGHPGSGVVVVRPDGHVGLRSGDAATAAVQDWLRLVGVAPGTPARHGH